MNIYQEFRSNLNRAIQSLFDINSESTNFTVESPKDHANGDLSSNIAMVLCKQLKQNPKQVAQQIASWLEENCNYQLIQIAGPGFLNITLTTDQWLKALKDTNSEDLYLIDYPKSKGKKVNLEFASPNPTGPMHIGHARGAIYGQVVSNILERCGYQVEREYYINDAGNQVDLLALSVIARARQLLSLPFEIPEGGYPGEYLIPIAQSVLEKFSKPKVELDDAVSDTKFFNDLKRFVIDQMMQIIKTDLEKIGVRHDIFTSEQHDVLNEGYINKAIDILQNKGLVYEGTLPPPKGKTLDDWNERSQLLFKSTDFGDDVDRPLYKSDGAHTYFAGDVGYHYHKVERGYDIMFLALGADHAGYVKRIESCVGGLAPNVEFKVLLFQLVKFLKDGEPYKMSKRAGNFISVDDILQEIDSDSLKFLILSAKNDTTLAIDFTKAAEQSKDNPVFYVQYAHARCCSVLRKLEESGEMDSISANDSISAYLLNPHEKDLVRIIQSFSRVVISAAESFEPLKLINYAIDLATKFHALWNLESYYFVDKNLDISARRARLCLVNGVLHSIKQVFSLLNIKGLDRM